jgi:signal transduction histidine kinase
MSRLAAIFFALAFAGALHAGHVVLDSADRAWLDANREVTVSYDPHWPPFSSRDSSGNLVGLDADLLQLLAARLGVRFVPVPAADWSDAYHKALAGEVGVLTGTARTPEREADFLFTRPYVAFSLAIITRETEPDFDDLSLLIGRRVAAVREHAPTLALKREYPGITLVECDSIAEAFRLVATGKADAVLSNLVTAAHAIRQEGITGLKAAGVGPQSFQIRLAVRRQLPALHRALDAAIASLSVEERQALLAPYVQIETGAVVSSRLALRRLLAAGLIALLLVSAFVWHNRRLRRELELRRRLQTELEESRDRLARLNEEKTGLMRMAAHDLRNPLTSLLLSLDRLRLGRPGDRDDIVDNMATQVDRMIHLIRNLLDVHALEAGTRRLHPEPIEIDAALSETLATFEPAALRKNVRLAYTPAAPGLAAHADRSALRQICDNLVSNAVKYSPSSSVVRITADRAPDTRFVRLGVSDEGPGVRPEEMARLFEKYTCLSARPTAGEQSTGLGLSIVKELVLRLGGRVWCESSPGHGAAFLVELPVPGSEAPL